MSDKKILISDSPQRVAYDLMIQISDNEIGIKKEERKDRTYWLTLYQQCYKAVYNEKP